MNCTISLAQMSVIPEMVSDNLEKGREMLEEASKRGSDMIMYPEMWTTGFHWKFTIPFIKEHKKILDEIASWAKEYKIWIHGSYIDVNEKHEPTNTSYLITPEGKRIGRYDKLHLFSLLKEDHYLVPGKKPTLVELPWCKCGQAICYDLRFPELFRHYATNGAFAVFLPAAFPHPRLGHWKTLLRARAIENQMYFIATNRVGPAVSHAGKKLEYFGHSCVIDPWGETLVEGSAKEEELLTAEVSCSRVAEIRDHMHVLHDRSKFFWQQS